MKVQIMSETTEGYIDFAARSSFLELRSEEYGLPLLDPNKYNDEINILTSQKEWDVPSLSEFIMKYPKGFHVLEALLQQQRFSKPQLIYFFFDVERLNSPNIDSIYEYAALNLTHDVGLKDAYRKRLNKISQQTDPDQLLRANDNDSKRLVTAVFKMAVAAYAPKIPKRLESLKLRVTDPFFADFSFRFANYVITILNLNHMLQSVNLPELLKCKRAPKDSKAEHGKYGEMMVARVLDKCGFINIDGLIRDLDISSLNGETIKRIGMSISDEPSYCTKKSIDGVFRPDRPGELKSFDVVIWVERKPRHLIEINFFTTGGSKIGINEGEYVALMKSIKGAGDYEFHWITDGNFWLGTQGQKVYTRLLKQYGTIHNTNLFLRDIERFKAN